LSVAFSDVEGGLPPGAIDGGGNINTDPLFVEHGYWDPNEDPDPDDDFWVEGDYHLSLDSPCIDTGDLSTAPGDETDMDGEPRVVDGDEDGIERIDMGADEYQPSTITIVSACSCMTHGSYGELCLALDDSTDPSNENHIEPRMFDIGVSTIIEFDLSGAVRDGEVSASVECIPDSYDGTIIVSHVDDDTIRVEFDPALSDQNCNIITLSGDVEDCYTVRMLIGDVDFSGHVSGGDRSTVKGQILAPLQWFNFWMDINADGSITGGDRSTVKGNIGHTVPECQ
jgi:hypothetical protein